MAIDKKLIHFKTKENFMSANGVNGNPNTPTSGSEETGNAEYGQIKGTSIVFIKDSQEIWTHGQLYKCSDPDLSNFVTKEELEELEKLSAPMISVTYNELKTLRDNSQLIPGQQYRITDYVTTTTQEDTRSAGHPFDVIVLALSENTLAEEAYAIHREFNIEDYKDAFSMTWGEKMMYLGTYEYEGKVYQHYESESQDLQMLVDFNEILNYYLGEDGDYVHTINPHYVKEDGDWVDGVDFGETIQFKYDIPTYFATSKLEAWQIWYCLDNDVEKFAWADAENGKGVIYRMIDEWNNDCPYDFKNIQFKRNLSFENGYAEYSEDGEEMWVYTFAGQSHHINNDEWSGMLDGSLESPFGHMSDEKTSTFHDNIIKPYTKLYNGNEIYTECGIRYLNDIVFLGYWDKIGSANDEDTPYYYAYCCYSNSFGNDSTNNSFGKNCYNNIFGNDCHSNTFGNSCHNNTFGNSCHYNSFGNDCHSNSFGNSCSRNSLGNNFYSNSFGNNCSSNNFGNNCYNNIFGNHCHSNSFGNDGANNSFGNECCSNSFGNGYYFNSFGNECNWNNFGNSCESNIFGNDCHSNTFDEDCNSNSFGNECYSNSFVYRCVKNSFGNSCHSNRFDNDCYSNSFGDSCYLNRFESNCAYNSFGNSCVSNTFGSSCISNSFGNYCHVNTFGDIFSYNSFGNRCWYNSFRLSASKTASLKKHCYCNHFDDYCSYNIIWNSSTTGSNIPLRNININRGVSGTDSNYNYINVATLNSEKEININNYNGHIYIDYGDTFKITYSELVDLRDNSQLIAGRQYRITDYVTSTSQKDTKSAEHQFDIIVTAINEYTLSEEAQAVQNFYDGYFDDSNLSAWKIWYSLDNDTSRFAWAGDERIETAEVEVLDTSNCTISVGYSYDEEEDLNKFDERVHFISQMWDDPTNEPYFEGNDINELISHWGYETDPDGVKNCLTLYGLNLEFDEETGEITSEDGISDDRWYYRGIVTVDGTDYDYWESAANGYYLDQIEDIDRKMYFLTDRIVSGEPTIITNTIETVIPLEPKGVIYRMIDEFGNDCPYDFKNIQFKHPHLPDVYLDWYYTFSVDANGVSDHSLVGAHCYDNHIGECVASDKQELNVNVFIAFNKLMNTHSNIWGVNSHGNSFNGSCSRNRFGDNCTGNRFGENCKNNVFGHYFSDNCLGNNNQNNTFAAGCSSNTLERDCKYNSFGVACISNILGYACVGNSFGNNCCFNSFRISEDETSSIKSYCKHNHLDDGCSYNLIWNSDTTSSSVSLKNINVNRGVSGTLSSFNIINVTTLNQDYEIQVAKNSKGEIKIYCEADLIA